MALRLQQDAGGGSEYQGEAYTSAAVSRSPSRIMEPITPMTGFASVPSEAVAVETLPMMLYQMK